MDSTKNSLRDYFEAARPAPVVSAYLFGSRARGTAHRESDVDVGVLLDYETDRSDRSRLGVRLASDLIAATHCNELDVVVLNDVSPELAAAVVTNGVRVYCADDAADHAFVRTTLLLHADLKPFLDRTRRLKLKALGR